jgi:MFS family permease
MIIAHVIKEFRLHRRWALLSSVVLSIVLVWTLYVSRGNGASLVSDQFTGIAFLSMAVVGAGLGLWVVLCDTGRGRWGLLLVRGSSRKQIFIGKLIAAVLMYLLTTTIALTCATIAARNTRWVLAPFSWNMLTPALVAQLTGLAMMMATMLVASRQASWIGSRFLPIASAIGMAAAGSWLAMYSAPTAGLLALLIAAILAVLAGAYFVSNGEYEPQRKWVKPLQFLMVAVGSGVLLAFIASISTSVLASVLGVSNPYAQLKYESYTIDKDGHPLIMTSRLARAKQSYRALDGTPVMLDEENERFTHAFASHTQANRDRSGKVRTREDRSMSWLREETYLARMWQYRRSSGVIWNLLWATGVVEGIEDSGQRVGYVGINGAADSASQVTPIQGRQVGWNSAENVVTDRGVFSFDEVDRRITTHFQTTEAEPLLSAGFFLSNEAPDDDQHVAIRNRTREDWTFLSIMTTQRLLVIRGTQTVLWLALPDGPWSSINVSGGRDGVFFVTILDYDQNQQQGQLWHVRADGTIVDKIPLPPLNSYPESMPTEPRLETMVGLFAFSPTMTLIVIFIESNLRSAALGILAAQLLLLVPLMYWQTRRHGLTGGKTTLWLAAVLLIGMTAILTLIFLRRKPTRIKCACGRNTRVDQLTCAHCGKSLTALSSPDIDVIETPALIVPAAAL